jgi:hypothetical protein
MTLGMVHHYQSLISSTMGMLESWNNLFLKLISNAISKRFKLVSMHYYSIPV